MRKVASLAMLALGILIPAAQASAAGPDDKYALVHGCFALKSSSADRFVAKDSAGGYTASAQDVAGAEPFRLQASTLAQYMLFGKQEDFLAAAPEGKIGIETKGSPTSDWKVSGDSGGFRLVSEGTGKALAVSGGGKLVQGGDGDAARFTFEKASGCATFPEADVNATGEPGKGETSYGEVSGFIDAHLHMMAFEFLGGRVRCGRPWSPYGIAQAMQDCPDHEPNGAGAVLENTLSFGNPAGTHDTTGWPTFKDWPHHASLTHEQVYYKFVERAWRGGLRMFVNLLVDNAQLCNLYPFRRNPCNEMNTARLELQRLHELQDYIDAQEGGPGKGWFRLVQDPFEARRVINEGKLAVVIGIEVSRLFDCAVQNDVPTCTREDIDKRLDEWYDRGVRSLEIVNKFDNAFSGVAGDGGSTGVVVNVGNHSETGRFWQLETCTGDGEDKPQYALPSVGRDQLAGNVINTALPPGTAPIYPEPPHCNARGLSDLGEHLIRRMMQKGMIVDPDHMSVLGRKQALALIEANDYPGVVSSHSWSSTDAYPRVYHQGGVITPYAGASTSFVEAWRQLRGYAKPPFYYGFSYGSDMNGFGAQGPPRPGNDKNPVRYPFKSFDGKVTLERETAGKRVWDINKDGVAHYGLYPDWIEDLRMIAGDQIVDEMARGSEAYLQMWERATGVHVQECRSARGRFNRRGLARVLVGDTPESLLKRAGQPNDRTGRSWSWCVQGKRNAKSQVTAVFTPGAKVALVSSNALGHRALRLERGTRASRLRGKARSFGKGLLVRRAGRGRTYVYGVKKGRISFIAVASRDATKSRSRLRSYLKLAGLR